MANNQTIQRHKNIFSDDFWFQLTLNEYRECLKSQIVTSNEQTVGKDENMKLLDEYMILKSQFATSKND